jgi:exoribonuclease R
MMNNLIAGTLELTSKVRYGLTSRGTPIYRFIPYDKRFAPLAVGCSARSLFHNIHAIVEPVGQTSSSGIAEPRTSRELQKANLIHNLGSPSPESELQVLLTSYAQDSRKELKTLPAVVALWSHATSQRERLEGLTFHIDPPGCRDVDDSFTLKWDAAHWNVAINIADVAHYVPEGSTLDFAARQRATSFYTPAGEAIFPMLPQSLSEGVASLLPGIPGTPKFTVSLCFKFLPLTKTILDLTWKLTKTETTTSYTYDKAQEELNTIPELLALSQIAGSEDTHIIVEKMMILYNTEAGKLLAERHVGILRRHKEGHIQVDIPGVPECIAYESAEYCLPTDDRTAHFGLGREFYAYASSPLRRYADLVNQRAIKKILEDSNPGQSSKELVNDLNRRQKQAKAFSRDLFFLTSLTQPHDTAVEGIVIESEDKKTKLWVPEWRRTITAKSIDSKVYARGTRCAIQWYADLGGARWKDKIVFRLSEADHADEV